MEREENILEIEALVSALLDEFVTIATAREDNAFNKGHAYSNELVLEYKSVEKNSSVTDHPNPTLPHRVTHTNGRVPQFNRKSRCVEYNGGADAEVSTIT